MKFSVVIPVYNAEKYLRECLDSVLNQTFGDWESVCVDDGSTDCSPEILDSYSAKDRRFVVVHQANAGEGGARNAGLQRVEGDWIIFLDSDDVLNVELLARLFEQIRRTPEVDLVKYGVVHFRDEEEICWQSRSSSRDVSTEKDLPSELLNSGVWSLAYRKSVVRGRYFSNLTIGADLVFVSACMGAVKSFVDSGVDGYGYRFCATSMSHKTRTPKMMKDTIDFRRLVFQNLLETGKRLDPGFLRRGLNQWLESTPALFYTKPARGEWGEIWQYWFDSLHIAQSMKIATPWQCFVLSILTKCRSRLLAGILCMIPYGLKRIGLHR